MWVGKVYRSAQAAGEELPGAPAVTGVLLAAGLQRSGSLTCKPAGLDSRSAPAVAQLGLPQSTATALGSCFWGWGSLAANVDLQTNLGQQVRLQGQCLEGAEM